MSDKCPKCGASLVEGFSAYFQCGTTTLTYLRQSIECIGLERDALRAENERLRKFAEGIRDDYDHETDAHRYSNGACRVCRAEAALPKETDRDA